MITCFRKKGGPFEVRIYFETDSPLDSEELEKLRWFVAEPHEPHLTMIETACDADSSIVEIGPRFAVETAFSTNVKAYSKAVGVGKVMRVEQSTMYPISDGKTREIILADPDCLDIMMQQEYPLGGLKSFELDIVPQEVQLIPILGQGETAMKDASKRMGLGMDDFDVAHFTKMFAGYGRDPTDVEIFQIGNNTSEHSRHPFWRGKQIIDGEVKLFSLFDLARAPLAAISGINVTVKAFDDNVGALYGYMVPVLVPIHPGQPSEFHIVWRLRHHTATGETHCHPTLICAVPGADTGAGGRERDNNGGGRGSVTGIGIAGYCVGNLFIPGYIIPGEVVGGEIEIYETPLDVLIKGSNGVSGRQNQYGEPAVNGFCRSFCQIVNGERREWRKPILYSAGVGYIDDIHVQKREPEKGMLIAIFGEPECDVGRGGASASSQGQGQNAADLDFASVQRGNGEYGQKTGRVVRVCVEMGEDNPIEAIHDSGAGGSGNVLTELMGKLGGNVEIRYIKVYDKTMCVLAIWSSEPQERYGVLIRRDKKEIFQGICNRERVSVEWLGEITGDGYVTVTDSAADQSCSHKATPVHLKLDDILGDLPTKTFRSDHLPRELKAPEIPKDLTFLEALRMVLAQLSVCSKGFLVHKADRSVGGRVFLQQCCGKSQVPIADYAVMADSFLASTGVATANGEQPLKMFIDPKAGARMSVAEAVTNLMGVGGIDLNNVRCRLNWMGPFKLLGEGALLYDAVEAMAEALIELGMAQDGGKDSSALSATVAGQLVKGLQEAVVLAYASMPDVSRMLTPDIKKPGKSFLGLVDLGLGKNRLGGSALLQALNQLGDESPDCDMQLLKAAWKAVHALSDCGVILSLHDRSDGGLATTLVEMCLGGCCGAGLTTNYGLDFFFNEEPGMVLEYLPEDDGLIRRVMKQEGIPFEVTGVTTVEPKLFGENLTTLRKLWEETSYHLELQQTQGGVAHEEFASYEVMPKPVYNLTFTPSATTLVADSDRFKVAVLREEGSNGDIEMREFAYMAGFDPIDIAMEDLLSGKAVLEPEIRGLLPVGGFSFRDDGGSAKAWAGTIRFSPSVKEMFERFRDRKDTFSYAPCNGCQLEALLGWIPYPGILEEVRQPRLIPNRSRKFESRWVQIKILKSPAIHLRGMEGSTFGIHLDHGEGQFVFPDPAVLDQVLADNLAPIRYVGYDNEPTMQYPHNPNGSIHGIAGLCSPDGRHFATMPHFERMFLPQQCHYWPKEWDPKNGSPALRILQNMHQWCCSNK